MPPSHYSVSVVYMCACVCKNYYIRHYHNNYMYHQPRQCIAMWLHTYLHMYSTCGYICISIKVNYLSFCNNDLLVHPVGEYNVCI